MLLQSEFICDHCHHRGWRWLAGIVAGRWLVHFHCIGPALEAAKEASE